MKEKLRFQEVSPKERKENIYFYANPIKGKI